MCIYIYVYLHGGSHTLSANHRPLQIAKAYSAVRDALSKGLGDKPTVQEQHLLALDQAFLAGAMDSQLEREVTTTKEILRLPPVSAIFDRMQAEKRAQEREALAKACEEARSLMQLGVDFKEESLRSFFQAKMKVYYQTVIDGVASVVREARELLMARKKDSVTRALPTWPTAGLWWTGCFQKQSATGIGKHASSWTSHRLVTDLRLWICASPRSSSQWTASSSPCCHRNR